MTGLLKPGQATQRRGTADPWNQFQTPQSLMDASVMTSDQTSMMFNSNMNMSPRSSSPGQQRRQRKSLNETFRRRQLARISEENQAILYRLQITQPLIHSQKMEDDYRKKIPVLRNMCEFPYILDQHSTKNNGCRSISLNNYSQIGVAQLWSQHNSTNVDVRTSIDSKPAASCYAISPSNNIDRFARSSVASTIRAPIVMDQRQADALDSNRVVHFKKGKVIGSGYYIIEISTNTSNMFIAAFDVESSASYLITIPFPKATQIVNMFNGDFTLMSDYLIISGSKLVIIKPNKIKREINSSMQPTDADRCPDRNQDDSTSFDSRKLKKPNRTVQWSESKQRSDNNYTMATRNGKKPSTEIKSYRNKSESEEYQESVSQ